MDFVQLSALTPPGEYRARLKIGGVHSTTTRKKKMGGVKKRAEVSGGVLAWGASRSTLCGTSGVK